MDPKPSKKTLYIVGLTSKLKHPDFLQKLRILRDLKNKCVKVKDSLKVRGNIELIANEISTLEKALSAEESILNALFQLRRNQKLDLKTIEKYEKKLLDLEYEEKDALRQLRKYFARLTGMKVDKNFNKDAGEIKKYIRNLIKEYQALTKLSIGRTRYLLDNARA